jgi:hypothetical protein
LNASRARHADRRYIFGFEALPFHTGLVQMNALRRLWKGDLPLPQAFWNWAVAGGIVVNALTSIAFLALIMGDLIVPAFVVGYVLSVPYNIVATVGVWRSAGHYEGERRWADLARIVTIGGMFLLSVT